MTKPPVRDANVLLEPEEREIFAQWLSILNEAKIPYLVGGAFAVHKYTGIWRFTKDLDVFLRPGDLKGALDVLAGAGFDTEVRDRYWLAKANKGPYLLDLIFSVAHGYIAVDDSWFDPIRHQDIAGVDAPIMNVEELIATKTYVTRSDRFDGSDIVHLIRAVKGNLDWERLLQILKEDVVLLLWHLLLFDYVYPGHASYLPQQLMTDLFLKARNGWSREREEKAFYGMMIDPGRFAVDVTDWDYIDERKPPGPLVDERGVAI